MRRCSAWAAKACWWPAVMPLIVGIRRHGQSKAVRGIPQAMSAKTEPPKTHSPATAAAISPAEAPAPIFCSAAVDRTVSRPCAIDAPRGAAFWHLLASRTLDALPSDRELSCGAGNFSRARRGCESLSSKTRSATADRSETHRNYGKRRPGRKREHSRHLTRAPPRAPYSRRSDRTHTSPPPPRPPATLEEAAPRRGPTN